MKLKKTIVFLLCFTMMFLAAACGSTTADGPEDYYQEDAAVTGSGYEYTASVDQDAHSCSVEYKGARVEVDEALIGEGDEGDYLVLRMSYWNELDLVSHDSDTDDPENQDSLDRSFVIRAVQGDQEIEARGEEETDTFEEDNAYELIDAGSSIECEYWFPVDTSEAVTIQILNPDGEDTVMAELTFTEEDLAELDDA